MKVHSARQLAADHQAKYVGTATVDIQAGAAPESETVSEIQAAGLSFGSAAGTKNIKATEHFLIRGGSIAKAGDVVLDMPADEAKEVLRIGKGVEATDDEVAAAQKAAKK